MELHRLEREFVYNGVKLPHTTPTMTPEQVRETYMHLYSEMATAAIEGPETIGGKLVYKFVRAIGAKGRDTETFVRLATTQCWRHSKPKKHRHL
jgi:PRTRC genetic system protein C